MRPADAPLAQLHSTARHQPRAHPTTCKTPSRRPRHEHQAPIGRAWGERHMHETPRRTAATPRVHPRTTASTSVPLPPPRAASLPSGVRQLALRALCNATRRDVRCKNRRSCPHTGPGAPEALEKLTRGGLPSSPDRGWTRGRGREALEGGPGGGRRDQAAATAKPRGHISMHHSHANTFSHHRCMHANTQSRARPDSQLREGSTTRKGRVLQNALLKPAKVVHMPQGDHFISGWTVSWQQNDKKHWCCASRYIYWQACREREVRVKRHHANGPSTSSGGLVIMTMKPTRVVLETLCVLDDAWCWCGAKDERHSRSATRTHFLRRRKNDTGQKSMVGKHNPREKGMPASAQRWGSCVHHPYATTPYATLTCRAHKSYRTNVLTPAAKEE